MPPLLRVFSAIVLHFFRFSRWRGYLCKNPFREVFPLYLWRRWKWYTSFLKCEKSKSTSENIKMTSPLWPLKGLVQSGWKEFLQTKPIHLINSKKSLLWKESQMLQMMAVLKGSRCVILPDEDLFHCLRLCWQIYDLWAAYLLPAHEVV